MTVSPRFEALTGARFIAALVVVIYHLWREAWGDGPVVAGLGRLVAHGPLAVSFFFVLSGFVLAWSLSAAAPSSLDDVVVDARAFWARRARRLLPVFCVAVVVAVPVALALARRGLAAAIASDPGLSSTTVASVFVPELLVHLTLLQAWIPGMELAINPPAWSLSVEVAFSLLLPILWRPLWRLAGARPWLLLGALWLVATVPGVVYVVVDADGLRRLGLPIDHHAHALWLDVLRYHPLVRLPELLAGVVVARLVRDGLTLPGSSAVVATAGIIVVVMGAIAWRGGEATVLTHNGLLLPAFVVIIVATSTALSPSWGPARLLASRPLVVLGEASYALYLLHVPLFYWVAGWSQRRVGVNILDDAASAIVVVVLVVAVSVVVHRLVERRLVGGQ
jgi:peptidoglycan/LPS O-acetylase OafA/YrhL